MNIFNLYRLFLHSTGATTDSRNCFAGAMFFALKGGSFNGNAFASQALEKGCAYVVIDEPGYAVPDDNRYVVVDDVLIALQQLANRHRRQLHTKVIGITGTNGKTTTKELVFSVLSQSFNTLCTQGNLNNHIGVPLTLLRLRKEHDIAVVEMGANHQGEIKTLAEIAEPDYGIITNVGKAHLEGFGSLEGVIATKKELYDFLRKRENATVFINYESPHLTEMAKGLHQITYGLEDSLYIHGKVTGNFPYLSVEWKEGKDGLKNQVKTQLIGEYNFPNVLAAIAVGRFFGVDNERINKALSSYSPQNNRSQLKETESNTLIIDAYNANPTSMMAALKNFNNMAARRKMVIIGDMRELGEESAAEHQKIIEYIDSCRFDKVILVGEHFAATEHSYTSYRDARELLHILQKEKPKGNTILIKGSNGLNLSQLTDYL